MDWMDERSCSSGISPFICAVFLVFLKSLSLKDAKIFLTEILMPFSDFCEEKKFNCKKFYFNAHSVKRKVTEKKNCWFPFSYAIVNNEMVLR